MFARKSFFRLKSISLSADFKWSFDHEVLPLMRRQPGFAGLVMLANPGSLERITISLWESAGDAASYNARTYPQVVKILSRTIVGTPKIHTFDEITFTLQDGNARPVQPDYTQATTAPTKECAASSPRSTLSTPSTSA